VFDDVLLRRGEHLGGQFIPFDPAGDYDEYVEGRPRVEAIHAFLDSRGMRIPEGRWDEGPAPDTACGLALRKGAALERVLHSRGIRSRPGAHRFLDAAGRARVARTVLSASASTAEMLDRAGLGELADDRIDAAVLGTNELRSRPAPDVLLLACERLGVDPAETVTITETPAGIAAGHAAGMKVLGVGNGEKALVLEGFGADRVVPDLQALLDSRLR
jgi:HAD superfamily hydrolase (TIGR01509 family)